jgi:hypothetical protein
LQYFVDGKLIATNTDYRSVPTTAFRLTLQGETWIGAGSVPPASIGHVYTDYVSIWAYQLVNNNNH